MVSVETIPGMRGGGMKENGGRGNSSMIYCKNCCKCHNVPYPTQQQQQQKE
jgi:hypothetical protein